MTALASIITEEDYPAAAIRDGAEGRVQATLLVSREGRVTGCAVTVSSGSPLLDATTCRILVARARFSPARTAGGRAVADTAAVAVVWQLPDEPLPAPAEGAAQPPEEQS